MIKTIALNKLVDSPRNVRRRTDEQADLVLKADIGARGLLQNLVVTPAAKPRGSFGVEAGQRRRHALQSLADEGQLPKDHPVPCFVLDASEAREASLAENFQRLPMNPADECQAFQQLIDDGADAEGIARRFGLTTRFVEGRLRLANLAQVVFEALGAGEISLDVAKAYAATPDRDRQAYVFEQMNHGYGGAHPDSIRRMMTQVTVSGTDRRARFVGEEAYVAAGGRIERDLFDNETCARWLDIALLERLASEKMEAAAAEMAAGTGFAWIRPTLDSWVDPCQADGLRPVRVERPPLSSEEEAEVQRLETEIDRLVVLRQEDETEEPARGASEAKIVELNNRIEAIVTKPPLMDEETKATLGAFLLLDPEGRPRLDAIFYAKASDEDSLSSDGADEHAAAEPKASRGRPAGLSQRLVDELAIQRRDILAVHVAADPVLALDLAIFLMIDREIGHRLEKSGSSLFASAPSDPVFGFKTPDAAATIARAEASDVLDRSWAEVKTRGERFDAFRALPDEGRAAWLAHAVARTLEASLNLPGERCCTFHDHLGQLLGVEVGRWWRPTGANYFDRVPKAVTLAALAEIGGEALAARYAKAKKTELAQSCERIFSGDFIAELEVKQAALAWVPEVMRFGAAGDGGLAADAQSAPGEEALGEAA